MYSERDGSSLHLPPHLALCIPSTGLFLSHVFYNKKYINHELPDVQAGFRKGRGTRDQIANISWLIKKAREFQKSIYFCFIDYAKAFHCVDHNKL